MTRPFFYCDKCHGAVLDGTTAVIAEMRTLVDSDTGAEFSCKSMLVYPIKEQKKSGETIKSEDVVTSEGSICLAFANDDAIDVAIEVLQKLKEYKPIK